MAASLAEVAAVMAGDESLRFCTHLSRLTLVYCQLVRCPFHFISFALALHCIPFHSIPTVQVSILCNIPSLSFFLSLLKLKWKRRAHKAKGSGLALAEGRSGGRGIRTAIVQAGYLE